MMLVIKLLTNFPIETNPERPSLSEMDLILWFSPKRCHENNLEENPKQMMNYLW